MSRGGIAVPQIRTYYWLWPIAVIHKDSIGWSMVVLRTWMLRASCRRVRRQ